MTDLPKTGSGDGPARRHQFCRKCDEQVICLRLGCAWHKSYPRARKVRPASPPITPHATRTEEA